MVKLFSSILFIAFMMSACVQKQGTPPQILKETAVIEAQACPKTDLCPVCEKPKPPLTKLVFKDYEKLVLGALEDVYFPVNKFYLTARIDTGATTSSLNAHNIVPFERDGKKWVRFEILDKDDKTLLIKRPIIKTIKVKRHGEEAQERYVVKMRLNISSISQFTELSLTDRSQYKFPALIGRNFLQGNAVVDVSKRYTKAPNKENK